MQAKHPTVNNASLGQQCAPYAGTTFSQPGAHKPQRLKVPLPSEDLYAFNPENHAADGKIILQRFHESWKDSVMLTVQGILYYIMQHFLRIFAIDHLLFVFNHDIQKAAAVVTGEQVF